jgi:hypothetical protein
MMGRLWIASALSLALLGLGNEQAWAQGCCGGGGPCGGQVVCTTYTTGLKVEKILFGPQKPLVEGNSSGLISGDIILQAGPNKIATLDDFTKAFEEAKKAGQPLRVAALDATKSNRAFVLYLDAVNNSVVMEGPIVPVNITACEYVVGRPQF